jgi:hypothetical protein
LRNRTTQMQTAGREWRRTRLASGNPEGSNDSIKSFHG